MASSQCKETIILWLLIKYRPIHQIGLYESIRIICLSLLQETNVHKNDLVNYPIFWMLRTLNLFKRNISVLNQAEKLERNYCFIWKKLDLSSECVVTILWNWTLVLFLFSFVILNGVFLFFWLIFCGWGTKSNSSKIQAVHLQVL